MLRPSCQTLAQQVFQFLQLKVDYESDGGSLFYCLVTLLQMRYESVRKVQFKHL